MGAAASKKRKRKVEEAPSRAPEGEALEGLAIAPYVPPKVATLVFAAVALAGAGYFVAQGVRESRVAEGQLAEKLLAVEARDEATKPFELKDLQGKSISMAKLQGKVVFLNFWATWCPPCVKEMPSMHRLRDKLADDDRFVMLAISADEDWAPVRKFFKGEEPPFSVLLDAGGDLAKKYGTEKFPETYVVVDGKLVGYIVGPRDWDTWYAEAYLRSLLGPRPT